MRFFYMTTIVLGLALAAIISCSRDSQLISPTEPSIEHINWVSSSVVYQPLLTKRDYSAVFFLTDWCGWCTKMKQNTLVDPEVIRLLDSAFNSVAVNPDADSMVYHRDSLVTCTQFARIYGITGVPTVVFFDRQGNVLVKAPGYREPVYFIEVLRAVLNAI